MQSVAARSLGPHADRGHIEQCSKNALFNAPTLIKISASKPLVMLLVKLLVIAWQANKSARHLKTHALQKGMGSHLIDGLTAQLSGCFFSPGAAPCFGQNLFARKQRAAALFC